MILRKEEPHCSVGFWRFAGRAVIVLRKPIVHGRGLPWWVREGLCSASVSSPAGSGSSIRETTGMALFLRCLQLVQGDKRSTSKAEAKENVIKAYTVTYGWQVPNSIWQVSSLRTPEASEGCVEPKFKIHLHQVQAPRPWTSYLTYKMAPRRFVVRNEGRKMLSTGLDTYFMVKKSKTVAVLMTIEPSILRILRWAHLNLAWTGFVSHWDHLLSQHLKRGQLQNTHVCVWTKICGRLLWRTEAGAGLSLFGRPHSLGNCCWSD